MELLKPPCFPSIITTTLPKSTFSQPLLHITHQPNTISHSLHFKKPKFKIFNAASSSILTDSTNQENETEIEFEEGGEKFDWYAHWYPIMPVCDLDKRRPHGKKVIGIDIVIWWDKFDQEWKVFDDACPHRLAPLSEGRIDQWGRLQCVYHGWCFNGSGDCKFIPQAPRDGPPIHTFKRACVAAYPTCVQNKILWFWPNTDPQYKDILLKKKPHYIPEIDDPSFTKAMICRDIPYGYEVLIENLMDPAHVPYAHHGIMRIPKTPESLKADREGGKPVEIAVQKLDVNGFSAKQQFSANTFIPPCVYYGSFNPGGVLNVQPASSADNTQEFWFRLDGPNNSNLDISSWTEFNSGFRFISPSCRGIWIEVPRVVQLNTASGGLYWLELQTSYSFHLQERKLIEAGPLNWHKSCFVPTKADALVVAFRRWLNKYCGGQVDWKTETNVSLPPTPPREQLFDRYRSHVVSCKSCSLAYKSLNVAEIVLQVVCIALLGVAAAVKQNAISVITMSTLVSVAVLCFVASKWLSKFVYKNFHYHDYDHAFR